MARTRPELAEGLARLGAPAGRLALVPTMGALHEGHLSLVDHARLRGSRVVASIFVNPLQFGPSEDLQRYPRDETGDLRALEERGADLIFAPTAEVMYPRGEPLITVSPGPMGDVLCGPWRPGHFRGVLTVVAKLFGIVRPDRAVFGRKDYQQAVLVRRMVHDLELGVEVDVAPTVREPDGLAMSSRNAYLSPEERGQAAGIYRGLTLAQEAFEAGERDPRALTERVEGHLVGKPSLSLQYAAVVHPETLQPVAQVSEGDVLAVAAFSGRTRLIDNVVLGGEA